MQMRDLSSRDTFISQFLNSAPSMLLQPCRISRSSARSRIVDIGGVSYQFAQVRTGEARNPVCTFRGNVRASRSNDVTRTRARARVD